MGDVEGGKETVPVLLLIHSVAYLLAHEHVSHLVFGLASQCLAQSGLMTGIG